MTIFVYKIINLVNEKFYIGVHEGEIDDNYMGSGKAIKAAINKYGESNFKKEIIQICESKEAAYLVEKELVTPELIQSSKCYNLNVGGKGGWYHIDNRGDKNPMKNPKIAKKVSESIKKSLTEEERKIRSDRMKKLRNDGTIIKPSGWNHTEESKQKMSQSNKGKQAWNKGRTDLKDSPATKENKKIAALKRMENGFDIGALTRGKKYNMKIVICPYCCLEGSGGNMTRFHFDNCKKKEIYEHT